MTDELVEIAARAICKSGKFETGQGTCAMICMDMLGSARAGPCHHAAKVHADLSRAILAAVTPAIEARVVGEIVAWLRRDDFNATADALARGDYKESQP